jgi:hypothetical protein
MKKYQAKSKWLLYSVIFCAMTFATLTYSNVTVLGSTNLNCCNYGQDCFGLGKNGTDLKCCFPYGGEQPCSPSQPNYCKANFCT